jgi:hypothetical protein
MKLKFKKLKMQFYFFIIFYKVLKKTYIEFKFMKNKENKKILIYGCGLIGSSLAFLLNDQEIYLKGDFSSEKKFLNEGYIIYKLSNIDKIFKIKVNFIDFEKEFFIPDLIIASFKLDAIYRWNEFIKKIDLKLQKKKSKR